jgi:cystathionine beta-lyase/cystathionine gamma-synthase
MSNYSAATYGIHADDRINALTDVAPPIHTATTFRYPRNPHELQPVPDEGEYLDLSTPLIYSRLTNANINRLETILAPLLYPGEKEEAFEGLANHVVSYSSGLSAFHALLVNLVPKVIAISGGYHGCHGVCYSPAPRPALSYSPVQIECCETRYSDNPAVPANLNPTSR